MIKTIIDVDGMACGMCEAHINDAIRREFDVKKVTSSHTKRKTEIISELPLDSEKIKSVISSAGYTVNDIHTEEYAKKRFSIFGK